MNKHTSDPSTLARKLAAAALLTRRRDHDQLVLADATLVAALDGSVLLSAAEKAALLASPLTLRRLRTLSQAQAQRAAPWASSAGMLRAADSGAALTLLETDDGHWALHFIAAQGHWQVVLKLDPGAPFAAHLLAGDGAAGAPLEVRDGAGGLLLQGRLDADGECEQRWPFAGAPAAHFQRHGARFVVRLMVAPAPPVLA